MKPIIIKSCPRGGTMYMAKLLHDSGYQVGHQYWRPGGIVGFNTTFVYYDMNVYLIGHMVRHPLRTIESLFTLRTAFNFMTDHTDVEPQLLREGNLDALARLWLSWNSMAEKTSQFRFRVEDEIDTVFKENTGCVLTTDRPPNTMNTHRKTPLHEVPNLTLSDFRTHLESMTYERLLGTADKYGYTLTE